MVPVWCRHLGPKPADDISCHCEVKPIRCPRRVCLGGCCYSKPPESMVSVDPWGPCLGSEWCRQERGCACRQKDWPLEGQFVQPDCLGGGRDQ